MPELLRFCVCLSLLLMTPGPARPEGNLEADIDRLVKDEGFTADRPGVAILVRQPGKRHFAKGYGLANLKERTPVTPKTLFELASLSKPFTATAVLVLRERGKLDLADDVRKYLPELPAYHKDRPITIRDLLQHISGLPEYMDFPKVPARHKGYWDNEDYLGEFARQRDKFPLRFPTGARYKYNNSNYMLLALIVARVSKQSFGSFLQEAVFVPAGMSHSFVYEAPTSHAPNGLVPALGYAKGTAKGKWRPEWGCPPVRQEKLLTVGDGGVWSNLEDLERFDEALGSNKLLRPATMKTALTPSKTADGKTNGYGLGWVLSRDGMQLDVLGHSGEWGGFRTSFHRYLADDHTVVILSNRGDFDLDTFGDKLNDVIEKLM